jgi:hypothetical protein
VVTDSFCEDRCLHRKAVAGSLGGLRAVLAEEATDALGKAPGATQEAASKGWVPGGLQEGLLSGRGTRTGRPPDDGGAAGCVKGRACDEGR